MYFEFARILGKNPKKSREITTLLICPVLSGSSGSIVSSGSGSSIYPAYPVCQFCLIVPGLPVHPVCPFRPGFLDFPVSPNFPVCQFVDFVHS